MLPAMIVIVIVVVAVIMCYYVHIEPCIETVYTNQNLLKSKQDF